MIVEDRKALRRLVDMRADIRRDDSGGPYPAFPYGDRRKKPCLWVTKDMLERWFAEDYVMNLSGTIKVTAFIKDSLTGSAPTEAGRDMSERDIYNPEGSLRPARINGRVTAFGRLARRRDHRGDLVLSAAQVEAGLMFARDYDRAGLGRSNTQNYEGELVDGGRSHDGEENLILTRIDRHKRVQDAIGCLGAGLDRVLIAVCCENWSLDRVERAENWAKSSGLTILKLALSRMVEFYGTEAGSKAG